ncbi:hypothetical protein PMAYCL1PPCAC_15304, partial [Pristionchus mayeri]
LFVIHANASLSVTLIAILAAVLPSVTCFSLLLYTFLYQHEKMANFALTGCPNASSAIPPIAYVIGVWEPQRLIWQAVLLLHFPARVLMAFVKFPSVPCRVTQ